MNELGIYTHGSCDGHGKGPANILLLKYLTFPQKRLLLAAAPAALRLRIHGKSIYIHYKNRNHLLDFGENLFTLSQIPEAITRLEAEHFKHRLIELLTIPGVSQEERRIRQFLQRRLDQLTDYTYVDRKGNLMAMKNCGTGPTILLSAHMDTVDDIVPDREIIEEGTMLKSSAGILGADDRAGIAVILEILSAIQQTNFNGTLKVAFTVEEEIGCRGSREIDQDFLEDVTGAIVIDRRGNRDIVTSYANFIPFCPTEYGKLFEKAGELAGMNDWQMTPGGLSDAKIFAEMGIPSVNLSAGYANEHTDWETVDYLATYETFTLVEALLHHNLIGKNETPEQM
ncbi:M20/M25/M40 family metallo-hydrolase [Bacillus rubiinfantis]|uniref:M20/M25/M40 family metallo-hydrolase n=1 Tax=Bacillus rubiinfantis TaxID=1499680 RepID=UPI0011DCE29E|nr:M20/M25/M40 family metallo-hydrolase [Bacillus rubiinfantis]